MIRDVQRWVSRGAVALLLGLAGCESAAGRDAGGLPPAGEDEGGKADCTGEECAEQAPCVFSFDCAQDQVCSDGGACVAAPATCEVYEPNGAVSYEPFAPPEDIFEDPMDAPPESEGLPDTEDNRQLYYDALMAGMAEVSVQGDRLVFGAPALGTIGPIRREVEKGWLDGANIVDLVVEGPDFAVAEQAATFAEIHREKKLVREHLQDLDEAVQVFEDPKREAYGGCEGVFDLWLRRDATDWIFDPDNSKDRYPVQSGFDRCRKAAAEIVERLDALRGTTEDEVDAIPVEDLARIGEMIDDYYPARGVDKTFGSCANYYRAREYVYATSLYGTYVRNAARFIDDGFPLVDLEVEVGSDDGTVGELLANDPGTSEAREILAAGVRGQREHLFELVTEPPQTPEELVPITMLNDEFLGDHPEFQEVFNGLVGETARDDRGRIVRGIGLGLGCFGGTALATWYTGPWAIGFGLGAAGLCGAEIIDSYFQYKQSSRLYQQLSTFRYLGVSDTLAAAGEVRELRSRLVWDRAFFWIGVAGAAGDAVALTGQFRNFIRGVKAARGIRGFDALAGLSDLERLEHVADLAVDHSRALVAARFNNVFPGGATDDVLDAIKAGRYFPFHDLGHTTAVVDNVGNVLEALRKRGLVDDHDVALGRIAAAFHDTVQFVDEAKTGTQGWDIVMTRVGEGVGEIASADAAADWMRAQNLAHADEIFSADDIARVERAIVDGTWVRFDPERALVPQPFVEDDALSFFRRADDSDYDFLPFAMSLADFGAFGVRQDDAAIALREAGSLLLEEHPGIVANYLRADEATRAANADDVAELVRGFTGFQPVLARGRQWFATQSYAGVLPDEVADAVRAAVTSDDALPAFADARLVDDLDTVVQQAANAGPDELLSLVGIVE